MKVGNNIVIINLHDGITENFIIKYDNELDNGLKRAQALKATCETDLDKLKQWFGVTSGFGTSNRVTLTIFKPSKDIHFYGTNGGYMSDGTSYVLVYPFDSSVLYGDDAVRAIFVSEMSEILMSYNNLGKTETWHPRGSDGEGLSRVVAAMFYKDAYYAVLVSDEVGPPINTWLLGPRTEDWISKIKATDTDRESFGCSIPFIYYLHSQLGFDMKSIVQKAGVTLEDTYEALTGKSGGNKAFTELLLKYFPIGKTTPLSFDNPFPLQDSNNRTLDLSFTESAAGPLIAVDSGTVKLSPFHTPACPIKRYKWTLSNIPEELSCVASVSGFGMPSFKWRINGQGLNNKDSISTTTTIHVDDPNDPDNPASSMRTVQLHYLTGDSSSRDRLAGILRVYNDDYPGHITLNVEVDVQELYASTDVTSILAISTIEI
jgi:hypothetical protein